MKLKYSLDKNDFLVHQLFAASRTKSIKYQRRKSWILLTIAFFMIASSFYSNDKFIAYLLFLFAIITLLFFPLFQKYQYKKHYKKFININYKLRFGEISELNFSEEKVEIMNSTIETKINYTAIEEIGETGDYFFLKLKTGGGLIIPKRVIENLENFRILLKTLKQKYNFQEIVDLNWKWK